MESSSYQEVSLEYSVLNFFWVSDMNKRQYSNFIEMLAISDNHAGDMSMTKCSTDYLLSSLSQTKDASLHFRET